MKVTCLSIESTGPIKLGQFLQSQDKTSHDLLKIDFDSEVDWQKNSRYRHNYPKSATSNLNHAVIIACVGDRSVEAKLQYCSWNLICPLPGGLPRGPHRPRPVQLCGQSRKRRTFHGQKLSTGQAGQRARLEPRTNRLFHSITITIQSSSNPTKAR
jgi:hypothetical protein